MAKMVTLSLTSEELQDSTHGLVIQVTGGIVTPVVIKLEDWR